MDKKKKILPKQIEETEVPQPRNDIPAMVTEVVDEDDLNGELETHAPVEQIVVPEVKPQEDAPHEKINITEKSKEVVEELFSKPGLGITEISISKSKSSTPLVWWAVVVVVAVITTGVGLFMLSGNTPSGFPQMMTKPTPTNTPIPTSTPAPLPAKIDLNVQVLNGGGVAGAATKMKNFLSDKGYAVTNLGNTDEYSYDTTQIQTKAGFEKLAEDLKTELSDAYTVGTVEASLSTSSDYDLVVIVGKK